jgi:hypothetical protein
LPRLTYTTVEKLANAITAKTKPIVNGDQNPPLTDTGLLVELTPVGNPPDVPVGNPPDVPVGNPPDVPVGIPPDVPVGIGEGVRSGGLVTVNVAVPDSPWVPVTVTVYLPRSTDGTLKIVLATVNEGPVYIVPTFDVPNVTLKVKSVDG